MVNTHNKRTVIDIAASIKDKYVLLDIFGTNLGVVTNIETSGRYRTEVIVSKTLLEQNSYTLKEAKHLISLITGRYGASGIHKEHTVQIMLVKLESWYETLINPIVEKLGADGNPL